MFDHLSSGFEGTIWSYRYPFFPHSVAAKELYITIRVTRSFPSTWKIIPSKQWDFHGLLWTFHMILTNQNGPNWGFHDLAIKKKQKPWWMPSGGLGWMGIHHLKSRREPSKFRMINHFQWYLSPVFFLMATYIYTHTYQCYQLYHFILSLWWPLYQWHVSWVRWFYSWLVVWNISIFLYIGNNNPNWLYFTEG